MTGAVFAPLRAELSAWRAERLQLDVWLRDDDAVAPTPALERLLAMCDRHQAPLALAVIPEGATEALAARLSAAPGVAALPHGWAHANHARPPAKKAEFGADRPVEPRQREIAAGWARIQSLFGAAACPIFTPPWNRIAPDTPQLLSALGLSGLSTFGPRAAAKPAPGVEQLNTHHDPIDWRGSRSVVDVDRLSRQMAEQLAARREGRADAAEPYGLLTHHLVHDEAIWRYCEDLLSFLRGEFADVVAYIDIRSHLGRVVRTT
ncbi:MAG: polysaccharide deacetylase family protein [Neomegalonema sp.]|nr:polysaccharide deacetylase family protein [Neomegalonema sp.]